MSRCSSRPLSQFSNHSPLLSDFLLPLHPIPALDPLTVEFALDVWCDSEFGGDPEAIHFPGEVLGELWLVDHQ